MMMAMRGAMRQPKPRAESKVRVHPTKKKLITVAKELLEETPLGYITTDIILEKSGISRGSLYHHFEDLSDLLETAATELFADRVTESVLASQAIVDTSKSSLEMLTNLFALTDVTQADEAAPRRFFRVQLIGLASDNPRLAERLSAVQDRLTDSFEMLFSETQKRGWIKDDINPRAAAVLIQAYTLGRVLDQLSSRPVPTDVWSGLIKQLIVSLFYNPDSPPAA